MILLTFDAAIFHELTRRAYLEFYVIDRCFAAGGTRLICLLLFDTAHCNYAENLTALIFIRSYDRLCRCNNKEGGGDQLGFLESRL